MTTTFSRPDPFEQERLAGVPDPDRDSPDAVDTTPVTLAFMAEQLLEVVKSAALAKGVVLPSRQSYYMAPIPADCEQVAVLFTTWTPTPALEGPTICRPFRWLAPMSVIITRCTPAMPTGRGPNKAAPSAAKMIEAAKLASADAEVLLEVVNRLDEVGGDLEVVTNAPSGGFQTVELNVQLLPVGSL